MAELSRIKLPNGVYVLVPIDMVEAALSEAPEAPEAPEDTAREDTAREDTAPEAPEAPEDTAREDTAQYSRDEIVDWYASRGQTIRRVGKRHRAEYAAYMASRADHPAGSAPEAGPEGAQPGEAAPEDASGGAPDAAPEDASGGAPDAAPEDASGGAPDAATTPEDVAQLIVTVMSRGLLTTPEIMPLVRRYSETGGVGGVPEKDLAALYRDVQNAAAAKALDDE